MPYYPAIHSILLDHITVLIVNAQGEPTGTAGNVSK
jgi:hypothetical protein